MDGQTETEIETDYKWVGTKYLMVVGQLCYIDVILHKQAHVHTYSSLTN